MSQRRFCWSRNGISVDQQRINMNSQAGLPRTGTNSLKTALEILGFGPCHHTETIMEESYPYIKSQQWQRACRTEDREVRMKTLRSLYEGGGFRSGCDYPTALFVDDLVDMYPEAKVSIIYSSSPRPCSNIHQFILGVRSSAATWRKSVNETIARMRSPALYYACFLLPPIRLNLHPMLRSGQLRERRRFGDVDIFYPRDSVDIYHRHNDWVRQVVPSHCLLEFNPADGWEPLCAFLDVAVPVDSKGVEVPYPRTNDSAQYKRMYGVLMTIGVLAWIVVLSAVYTAIRLCMWASS